MTTIIEALRQGLAGEMDRDPRVFVMGEDIGIGGSFHLTLGLLDRFGQDRIRDTPVSEAGFVGLAVGAAVAGLRPVCDFQYGDFLLCAADQVIQQATKLRLMSGGQVTVPLVLHAPTGASGRGAQHANSIENIFYGVPGLILGVPSTPYDAKGMMVAAIRHDGPVLICSQKHLYGTKGRAVEASATGDVPEEQYEIPIGKAVVRRPGADVTIASCLLMAHRAMSAAETLAAEGIEAEVVDMRWLAPLDVDTVIDFGPQDRAARGRRGGSRAQRMGRCGRSGRRGPCHRCARRPCQAAVRPGHADPVRAAPRGRADPLGRPYRADGPADRRRRLIVGAG